MSAEKDWGGERVKVLKEWEWIRSGGSEEVG